MRPLWTLLAYCINRTNWNKSQEEEEEEQQQKQEQEQQLLNS